MKRFLVAGAAALGLIFFLAACTPEEASKAAIDKNFDGPQYDKAMSVAACESNFDPTAVSPSGQSVGLFQINRIHRGFVNELGYSWSQMKDPWVNAYVAKALLYVSGGWHPWACA